MSFSRVKYHATAKKELAAALRWYAERDPVVAERFSNHYLNKLDKVMRFPGLWAVQRDGTRHVYLRPYSYYLVVRDKQDSLQIVAVAHTSRRWRYWRKRLRD
jgi:plasmid stabilization system protein ParE